MDDSNVDGGIQQDAVPARKGGNPFTIRTTDTNRLLIEINNDGEITFYKKSGASATISIDKLVDFFTTSTYTQ